MATGTEGQVIAFGKDAPGSSPAGWRCGKTGSGRERWEVAVDATSPDGQDVLRQSGAATFAWCVRDDLVVADGFVEVNFKPVSGREDQAGGVVWRWKDGDNYYVARANALENNVSLYYTQHGRRITIRYVDAPVEAQRWHTLRVEFQADAIRVILNGICHIEATDEHIAGQGCVGVWTKADSVTEFAAFSCGGGKPVAP